MVSTALEGQLGSPLCNPQRKGGYSPTLGLRRRQFRYPRLVLGIAEYQMHGRKDQFSRGLLLWRNKKEYEIIASVEYENYDPQFVKLNLGQKMIDVKGLSIRSIKSLVLRQSRKYWREIISNAQQNYKKFKGVYLDEFI